MTIDELKTKHFNVPDQAYKGTARHSNISIQFTIESLKSLRQYYTISDCITAYIEDKIKELEQYYDKS